MAKLYRDPATDEYYIETAMDGEFATLRVHPEGRAYLEGQGITGDGRIPAEVLVALEENGWLSMAGGEISSFTGNRPVDVNESETGAIPAIGHEARADDLPVGHLEPRPWMEHENVERFVEETEPGAAGSGQPTESGVAGSGQPSQEFAGTHADKPSLHADKANAHPITHPEDAVFFRNVWFWVLVVAAVLIVVWVLFEVL